MKLDVLKNFVSCVAALMLIDFHSASKDEIRCLKNKTSALAAPRHRKVNIDYIVAAMPSIVPGLCLLLQFVQVYTLDVAAQWT